MLRFIGKRLWHGGLTLAALVTLTFFVMRLAPGGPFSRNRKISPEVQANIEAAFHLDEPIWQQFGRFVWGVLRLDLGPSTRHRDYSVNDLIASGLPSSRRSSKKSKRASTSAPFLRPEQQRVQPVRVNLGELLGVFATLAKIKSSV